MTSTCNTCNVEIPSMANFCHKCGAQQKCSSCGSVLLKAANNCIGCGITLSKSVNTESTKATNTIEFNETNQSRSYKVAFTDNVGATIVDVMKNMLETKIGNQFKLNEGSSSKTNPPSDTNEYETEDTFAEEITQTDTAKLNNEDTIVDLPHINDVEATIDCSEPHWILIYSFYNSNGGKGIFTRKAVFERYKAKRETATRIAAFPTRWKRLFNGFFKTVKDGEFKLTEKGVSTALGLINKKITSVSSEKSASAIVKNKSNSKNTEDNASKKPAKTSAKSITIEEFDLSKGNKKPSLEDFLRQKAAMQNTDYKILTIAYYVSKYCNQEYFSEGHIEYAYKVLGLKGRPLHLYQTIVNAKGKYLWYDRIKEHKKWKLTRAGEIFVEEKLPQPTSESA